MTDRRLRLVALAALLLATAGVVLGLTPFTLEEGPTPGDAGAPTIVARCSSAFAQVATNPGQGEMSAVTPPSESEVTLEIEDRQPICRQVAAWRAATSAILIAAAVAIGVAALVSRRGRRRAD